MKQTQHPKNELILIDKRIEMFAAVKQWWRGVGGVTQQGVQESLPSAPTVALSFFFWRANVLILQRSAGSSWTPAAEDSANNGTTFRSRWDASLCRPSARAGLCAVIPGVG